MTLNPEEIKVDVSTLSKRRAWIKKSLDDNSLAQHTRAENAEILRLLESSIQKLTNKHAQPTGKTIPPETRQPTKVASLAEARILVAEDDDTSAELLLSILNDMGITTLDRAKDGMEAFDYIKKAEEPYHIILCDWDMPELSGIEVHAKALASNTLRDAHFVMVTAVSQPDRIKKAGQQGVDDYIVKPIDMDSLEEKVKVALGLE